MISLLAAAEFNRRRRKRRVYLTIAVVVTAITLGVGWCKHDPGELAGWWCEQGARERAGEQPDGGVVGLRFSPVLALLARKSRPGGKVVAARG